MGVICLINTLLMGTEVISKISQLGVILQPSSFLVCLCFQNKFIFKRVGGVVGRKHLQFWFLQPDDPRRPRAPVQWRGGGASSSRPSK